LFYFSKGTCLSLPLLEGLTREQIHRLSIISMPPRLHLRQRRRRRRSSVKGMRYSLVQKGFALWVRRAQSTTWASAAVNSRTRANTFTTNHLLLFF